MHPNAPKRGLRAAPGHNPIQTITMGFKIRRASNWLLTLRWLDEFAGHSYLNHYDGLKLCPAFTMDLENARLFTIILQRARQCWAFGLRLARLIHH